MMWHTALRDTSVHESAPGGKPRPVCRVYGRTPAETHAKAKLIASMPELISCLRQCRDRIVQAHGERDTAARRADMLLHQVDAYLQATREELPTQCVGDVRK